MRNACYSMDIDYTEILRDKSQPLITFLLRVEASNLSFASFLGTITREDEGIFLSSEKQLASSKQHIYQYVQSLMSKTENTERELPRNMTLSL